MKNPTKNPRLIALTGGGSGGHITPILSVAREIKRLSPDTKLLYIGQKGDDLADVILSSSGIDHTIKIRAGKWRRYNDESIIKHILDIKTVLLNIRDIFYVAVGIMQAYKALLKYRPDGLFVKGGFVGLPVGIAANVRGVKFITHDSDTIPGLTNRIIGRWASLHATGMPKELYNYPKDKTVYTGIPITDAFQPVNSKLKQAYRQQAGLPAGCEALFVVGGGLGARRLNQAVLEIAPRLLKSRPKLHIINVSGRLNYSELNEAYQLALGPGLLSRVKLVDFTNELHIFSGAADVVIMRAGATNMSEMARQGKCCILVPNPQLTGGHQVKNAKSWLSTDSVKIFDESAPADELSELVSHLLDHPKARVRLEHRIKLYAKPQAATSIAKLLLNLE